jgi:hypothetical protein
MQFRAERLRETRRESHGFVKTLVAAAAQQHSPHRVQRHMTAGECIADAATAAPFTVQFGVRRRAPPCMIGGCRR